MSIIHLCLCCGLTSSMDMQIIGKSKYIYEGNVFLTN